MTRRNTIRAPVPNKKRTVTIQKTSDSLGTLRVDGFFKSNQNETRALIEPGSEANAMHLACAAKLGLSIRKTDVGAQKIDGTTLETFGKVIASFQIQDKLGNGMPFLTLSSANLLSEEKGLVWRTIPLQRPYPRPGG